MNKELTEKLRSFWNVSTFEEAQFGRVTLPRNPDEYNEEVLIANSLKIARHFPFWIKTVLDYGVGIGRIAKYVAELGYQVRAVDISPNMLEFAKQFVGESDLVTYHLTDGDSLEFPDNSIDASYCFYVFQHIPTWEIIKNILSEVYRVLKKDGVFIVQSIDRLRDFEVDFKFSGVTVYTGKFIELATQIGFSCEIIEFVEHPDYNYYEVKLIKPV